MYESDFIDVTTPIVFHVHVFDYITGKSYDSKQNFSSYDEVTNWIQHYDFVSSFGESPLGISIVSSPKLDFGAITF